MAALRKGEAKHVYLLAGEEHYYIEKAKAAILECLFPAGEGLRDALEEAAPDMDADALIGLLETVPFFVPKHVVLVQDSPLFREKKRTAADGEDAKAAKGKKSGADKKEERLLHLLADMPDYAYVIFLCAGKADKRRKAYKAIEAAGAVLDADAVRPWEIGDWLAGKLAEIHREFDREAHAYFMGAVSMMHEVSLSYLDKEFEKLALYTTEKRIGRAELAAVLSGLPPIVAGETPSGARRARQGIGPFDEAQSLHRGEAGTREHEVLRACFEAGDALAHRRRLSAQDGAGRCGIVGRCRDLAVPLTEEKPPRARGGFSSVKFRCRTTASVHPCEASAGYGRRVMR